MPASIIISGHRSRHKAIGWLMKAPEGCLMLLCPPKRTPPQNNMMWPLLSDIAEQVTWKGKRYTSIQWKGLLLHAYGVEVQWMEGLNGEAFPLGLSTSSLSKETMSEFLDFIQAWGAENGVIFSDQVKHGASGS